MIHYDHIWPCGIEALLNIRTQRIKANPRSVDVRSIQSLLTFIRFANVDRYSLDEHGLPEARTATQRCRIVAKYEKAIEACATDGLVSLPKLQLLPNRVFPSRLSVLVLQDQIRLALEEIAGRV